MSNVAKALEALNRHFSQGSRVTNCVSHMNFNFNSRPDDCKLCQTDIRNHMNLALSANAHMNQQIDDAKEALK